MADGPNPLVVAWSIRRSLKRVRPPRPTGTSGVNHHLLEGPLRHLAEGGPRVLPEIGEMVRPYLDWAGSVDPDLLERNEALAMWVNLYNAGTLLLASTAGRAGESSVLRVPSGFRRPFVDVAGESLSLDAIEHAKVRRFGDPRVHAALVCGSVSCPTLSPEPYRGPDLSDRLDHQMSHLLGQGALVVDERSNRVQLSKVFLWYGADFVRPSRMPTFAPARRRAVLAALTPWIDPDLASRLTTARPRIEFQPYDWGLACAIG